MKKCFWVALLSMLYLIGNQSFAQYFPDPFRDPKENTVLGGVGVTWIDDQPFTTLTFAPDINLGNWGFGLYLQFLMDSENNLKLRKDEFEDGPGILRAIRYVRLGQKYDNYYFRVGMLDRAMLGNGFLLWNYNNGSNYDKRKIGFAADIDFGSFGFESVAAQFGTDDLNGFNVFVRPFQLAKEPPMILKHFRLYSTFVRDSEVATATADSTTDLSAYNFGADLRWLNLPVLTSTIYGDIGKYNDYGSGKAVGINFIIPNVIGLMELGLRYERRFNDAGFVPSIFGPLYELERQLYSPTDSIGALFRLETAEKTQGYFGEIAGHLANKILLVGNYQRLTGVPRSGILHLEAAAPDILPNIELRAYYDKAGISDLGDVTTLDAKSIATGEINYQLNRFMVVSTIYRWYWVEDPNNPGVFKPLERIEPRLSFRYRF